MRASSACATCAAGRRSPCARAGVIWHATAGASDDFRRERRHERGDDEREETADADRVRPTCIRDRGEADPRDQARTGNPCEESGPQTGEQDACLTDLGCRALAVVEASDESETKEERQRRKEDQA